MVLGFLNNIKYVFSGETDAGSVLFESTKAPHFKISS